MKRAGWGAAVLLAVGLMRLTPSGPAVARARSATPSVAAGRHPAQLVSAVVRVEDVDRKSRTLRLRGSDGKRLALQVPDEVEGFDGLVQGDRIDVSYYQPVALALLPTGADAPATEEREIDVGEGVMARALTGAMTVTRVDTKSGKLEAKAADGTTATVSCNDPALLARLKTLRPGDVVQIAYTEAVVASLEPHVQR